MELISYGLREATCTPCLLMIIVVEASNFFRHHCVALLYGNSCGLEATQLIPLSMIFWYTSKTSLSSGKSMDLKSYRYLESWGSGPRQYEE
jgi:hypothetical protein